jgi:hypothetical protein
MFLLTDGTTDRRTDKSDYYRAPAMSGAFKKKPNLKQEAQGHIAHLGHIG